MTTFIPGNSAFVSTGSVYDLDEGDALIIGRSIALASVAGSGVETEGTNRIQCNGTIGGKNGVFLSSGSVAKIGTTGLVSGSSIGVGATNGVNTIENHGTIFGGQVGIYEEDSSGRLTNYGTILAGNIAGDNAAIFIHSNKSTVTVNNGLVQTQKPGSFAFLSESSSVDTVVNAGTMIGNVALGDGKDTFDTSRGKVVGKIDGGAGDDTITGSAYADRLTGGADEDTFVFKSKPNAAAVDHITDFAHGRDTLSLENAFFKLGPHQSLATAFHDITKGLKYEQAEDHILYNRSTGWLSYDVDGKGGHAPVHFATLDKVGQTHPLLTYHDFLMS